LGKRKHRATKQWRTIDLHIHTPASGDYQEPEVTYLQILQRAEARGLDIIAITDHNTVAGYRRRLFDKLLVLPGFEFTATFGFHILGIFPPDKPVREIEHLLIDLNIPTDQLDDGSATVGATSDVLTAYSRIAAAGGLVIAAHANSSNGVAMRGFAFGGQTKIAYTQDLNLHALEVTDLEQSGKRTTAAFFNGTKPEYPRRMHCIQGSDAHRLTKDTQRKKNFGLGDRTTDVLIQEVSFDSLLELFQSHDFARTRPHRFKEEPAFDFIHAAREEGASIVQDFHEGMSVRGGKRYAIIADVCAFANTNGGTLYIGLNADPRKPVAGLPDPDLAVAQLDKEINNRISPPLSCTIDVHETSGKKVIRILIPRGEDPPYAVDDNKIYVRSETETGLAVRDEIVGLVLRGSARKAVKPPEVEAPAEALAPPMKVDDDSPPRTGVEVVAVDERRGTKYFTMRDLRNGNVVKNVTPKSARRLWHYAITSYNKLPADLSQAKIQWQGKYGLVTRKKQGKRTRFDLVQRVADGYRYYFGVTEDGIHGPWKQLVGQEDD